MHDLKMQDWKMTDNILTNSEHGVWKMQDWKMTDKILANSGQNYGVWKMQLRLIAALICWPMSKKSESGQSESS